MVQDILTKAFVNFKSFLKFFITTNNLEVETPPACLGEFLGFLLMIKTPFKQFVAITMN